MSEGVGNKNEAVVLKQFGDTSVTFIKNFFKILKCTLTSCSVHSVLTVRRKQTRRERLKSALYLRLKKRRVF